MGGWLAACATPTPTPTPALISATAAPTAAPTLTVGVAPATPTAPPATVPELVVCLTHTPERVWRYAPPARGQAHVLALLEAPLVTAVEVREAPAQVQPLAPMVDALGRLNNATPGLTVYSLTLSEAPRTLPEAEAWTLPQRVVRFHLRRDLRWSDGAPVTAADSVWAFETIRAAGVYDPLEAVAARTAAYRAVDAYTVEWVGLPGYIDPAAERFFWPPLPQQLVPGLAPAEAVAALAEAPLSYGPFTLAERGPEAWVFTRNPMYPGQPGLERVQLRFIAPTVEALGAAACDVIPEGEWPAAQPTPGLAPFSAPSGRATHLVFGLHPAPDYAPAAGREALTDRDLRQALGQCAQGATAAGAAQLDALGWPSVAGVRTRGAVPLALTLVLAPEADEAGAAQAEAVRAGLAECGAVVTVRSLTVGEWWGDWPEGVLFGRRFDLALVTWDITRPELCGLFLGAQIAEANNPVGVNFSGLADPAYDALCRGALTAPTATAAEPARAAAYQWLSAQAVIVPLTVEQRVAAVRPAVQGLAWRPGAGSVLAGLEAVTVLAP